MDRGVDEAGIDATAREQLEQSLVLAGAFEDGTHRRDGECRVRTGWHDARTLEYELEQVLLERGHLYIAQPPLYKVKKGKVEQYLANDDDLARFLMTQAAEERVVKLPGRKRTLEGVELRNALERLVRFRQMTDLLARRGYEPALIDALLGQGLREVAAFQNEDTLEKARAAVEAAGFIPGDLERDEEHGRYTFDVRRKGRGRAPVRVGWDLVSTPEYRTAQALDQDLADLKAVPILVATNGSEHSVAGRFELLDHLMSEAKRGMTVQRYKGLGEMNPGQLWETTMNPETRRMLQVTVADAVEADEIFTVLMGDAVEPRRKFIEDNALSVRNLDI